MQNTERIAKLIKKQLDGTLTPGEKRQLQHWAQQDVANQDLLNKILQKDTLWEDVLLWLELENTDQEEWRKRLENKVLKKISQPTSVQHASRMLHRLIPYAAAVLLFVIAGGLYYYLGKHKPVSVLENRQIVQ